MSANASVSLGASGANVSLTKPATDTLVLFNLYGTYAGVSGVFEQSPDGTNWFPLAVKDVSSNAIINGSLALTDNSSVSYMGSVPLMTAVRFRATAYTSGTLSAYITSSAFSALPDFGGPTSGATFTTPSLVTATLTGVTKIGDTSTASYIKATTFFTAQPTPTAETATSQTYLAAEIATRIITSTQTGAVTGTLDTGTNMDTAFAGAATNDSLDFTIINLGSSSGAVTLTAAAGHTIVGNATIAIATSATFRTRRTGANTWVCYRLNG